jgi:ABC-type phosphate transport system auxiliary subunit
MIKYRSGTMTNNERDFIGIVPNDLQSESILNRLMYGSDFAYFIEDNVQLRSNGKEFYVKPSGKPGYNVTKDEALELIKKSLV